MLNTFLQDWLAVGGTNIFDNTSLSTSLTSCFLSNSCAKIIAPKIAEIHVSSMLRKIGMLPNQQGYFKAYIASISPFHQCPLRNPLPLFEYKNCSNRWKFLWKVVVLLKACDEGKLQESVTSQLVQLYQLVVLSLQWSHYLQTSDLLQEHVNVLKIILFQWREKWIDTLQRPQSRCHCKVKLLHLSLYLFQFSITSLT